jgi:beta-lactamase class A
MATLFHKVELGEIDLEERLVLREEDKSLGNNDLQFFRAGLNLTLFDLCYEMIVHSDNTATDMIHYRLGLDVPNAYMASIGLDSFDLRCPCREYYFLLIGWADRFKGMRLGEIAKKWKKMTGEERSEAFAEIRRQNLSRSMLEAQQLAIELWGLTDERETREDRLASSAIDNFGSPKDVSMLLEQIVTNKIACPVNTSEMIDFMLLCDTRDRLPAKLPPSVLVANKTGTVPGTINDCAIIYASKRNVVCCSCLSKNVKYADMKKVEDRMADIGLAAYETFKK